MVRVCLRSLWQLASRLKMGSFGLAESAAIKEHIPILIDGFPLTRPTNTRHSKHQTRRESSMSEEIPDPPLPLLITGLTGVAGYNAFHHFRQRYPGQVVGIRQVSNWPLQGEGIVACDADDGVGLNRLFDEYQFTSVLNTAGNCALKSCELDPEMAWAH